MKCENNFFGWNEVDKNKQEQQLQCKAKNRDIITLWIEACILTMVKLWFPIQTDLGWTHLFTACLIVVKFL